MRIKLIAFDLDGVLVDEPSAWWTLHQAFGTYEKSKKNLRAYEAGNIDYPEFMRRDIRLWGTRTLQEVEAILHNFTLARAASETCNALRRRGYQLAIVSAGIDILARAVAEELGIEHWVANGLKADAQGFLTGEGVFRVDLLEKHRSLESLVRPLSLTLSDVAAVGDSKYDIPLIQACGTGIAIVKGDTAADPAPWPAGCPQLGGLEELLEVLFSIDSSQSRGHT